MLDQYLCPNINCNHLKKGRKGKSCPECGEPFKKVGIIEGTNLIQQKKKSSANQLM
ncbi:MAG TPA: hypothetical protein PKI66_07825 [Methanobacteriaceae archaeon]|jgi:uncharacterized protein (UPF0212 family)|nr:hypothetical protein [Euryarchaeota archaeon]HNR26607.1 hypothetical protein [Methanobacteriaceae archaeon]HNS25214.1 hypothetical protein [Methanobacteriaceae archaeon]